METMAPGRSGADRGNEGRKPELLLPAGSFDSGIAAIEGGADALYFGFADFSARKQARNLDGLEYRRLLRFARGRGVRLYAALNTVVLERELGPLSELLAFLGRFPPDAVIFQDWGLARLVRARLPGIALHASTQTAARGLTAARLAAELGASRLVLPRETSLSEMRRLSSDFPDMELEAFVHGALCYSFSGLCLASGIILDRSGNRGACAQLCRSYYDAAPSGGFRGGRGYWFSCRDLRLVDRLGDLAAAGLRSLKVEGRMKSPEYCHAVARLYRGALDGAPPEELAARRREAETAFSREGTEAWLLERGGARLLDAGFPGHRGSPAGRVVRSGRGRAVLELSSSLGLRDGLLVLGAAGAPGAAEPLQFAVADLRDARSGRPLGTARAGDLVEVDCPGVPAPGSEARRISSRRQDRRAVSPEEYPPALERLPLRLFAEGSGSGARLAAAFNLPRFDGLADPGGEARIEAGEPVALQPSRTPGGFERALSVFEEGGDADFRLAPEGELGDLAGAFVPPSILKREKNRLYSRAAELVAAAQSRYAAESAPAAFAGAGRRGERPRLEAPPRAAIVFPREGLPQGLCFATPRLLREGAALPNSGGVSWLPLAPLAADLDEYGRLVLKRVESELAAGRELCVGLDALHHLALARELAELAAADGPGLSFFLDIHLYVANRLALAAFDGAAPRLAFAYAYLEAPFDPSIAALGGLPPLAPVGEGFSPPLFLSLGCLRKHHLEEGRCPPACDRSWALRLADRDRRYVALVEDCVTMLFAAR